MSERRDAERVFGRYREISGDFKAFLDAVGRPLPKVLWAQPERIARSELARLLDGAEPVASDPLALRVPIVERAGMHWAHWAGLYYVQEEASLAPVRALDPRPGDRVLDLCAAPGGKTARIAFALGNRGTVVANDRSVARISALGTTIARLGLRNVTCTIGDGAHFPLTAGPFDKILVDAPCSAEGTANKTAQWRSVDPDARARLAHVQRDLLRRAIALARVGTRIVYSTCTFAPEENELVLDAVLREHGGRVRVEAIDPFAGLATSPGLDRWEGRDLLPEIARAIRLWPHRSATGGFFVARLEVLEAPSSEHRAQRIDHASDHALLAPFIERFGLPTDVFAGHRLLASGRFARLVADDHVVPDGASIVSTGLIVTRTRIERPKLSTAAALSFGRHASRHVVELDAAGADAFQRRASLPVDCDDRGYVLARCEQHPLGLGLVRDRVLASEFPAAWARTASGAATVAAPRARR